jgi:hypothetical protein
MFVEFTDENYSVKIIAARITHIEGDKEADSTKIYLAGRDHPIFVQLNIKKTAEKIAKALRKEESRCKIKGL